MTGFGALALASGSDDRSRGERRCASASGARHDLEAVRIVFGEPVGHRGGLHLHAFCARANRIAVRTAARFRVGLLLGLATTPLAQRCPAMAAPRSRLVALSDRVGGGAGIGETRLDGRVHLLVGDGPSLEEFADNGEESAMRQLIVSNTDRRGGVPARHCADACTAL